MILGSMFVSNQHPDWVEAKPKKFAWILGLMLGAVMAYFIVFGVLSPIRMLTCVACLILLFTESVFGICLGCMLYKKFNVDLQNCPGDVCEAPAPKRGSTLVKLAMLTVFGLIFVGTYQGLKTWKYHDFSPQMTQVEKENLEMMIESVADASPTEAIPVTPKSVPANVLASADEKKDCTPPKWAVAMGHKELWKEHHGCK